MRPEEIDWRWQQIDRELEAIVQEDLAFEANVSRQYVSLLKLNEKSPIVDVLVRICKAMGVSAGRMIVRVEESGK